MFAFRASYDATADGIIDISDPVSHLSFLFLGGAAPPCLDALDFNQDGVGDISDPVAALSYLFAGGPEPAKGLGCQAYAGCGSGCQCGGACP